MTRTFMSCTMPRNAMCLVAVGALAFAACGGDDDDAAVTTSAPVTVPEPTTTTTSEPAEALDVRVYFLTSDALLATASRSVPGDDVPRAALEALLAGPEGLETELGWASAIPDGTELLDVSVDGAVATVDLSSEFEAGGGSASVLGRVAQVVFTLTQFPGVDTVEFAIDGVPADTLTAEGLEVGGGVGRDDFTAVLPNILVEAPTPGAEVTSPVTITGLSNTFEATIQYNVTDGEGLIVAEGFHTGGGTTNEWLPFEFEVEFVPERPGFGAVILFTSSARDGSQQDVVEIPIRV